MAYDPDADTSPDDDAALATFIFRRHVGDEKARPRLRVIEGSRASERHAAAAEELPQRD